MSWMCFLCYFQEQRGKLWVWHYPLPGAVPGAEGQRRGGCGEVERHWGASWGHLYPLQVACVLQNTPDPLGSVLSPFRWHSPTLVPSAKLFLRDVSCCLPLSQKFTSSFFHFTMPNPWSEKGISCLYMELQTCIKPPKMFLSKNLDGCQLP